MTELESSALLKKIKADALYWIGAYRKRGTESGAGEGEDREAY